MFNKTFSICLLLVGIQIINAGYYIDEYYFSYPLMLNWFAANRFCTYYNMHLIDVPHEKEYNRIVEFINVLKRNTTEIGSASIWTSGVRFLDDTSYYWETTGQPIIFANWYPGDPNFGTEKCLFLYHLGNYKLADATCEAKCIFMCRKSVINPLNDGLHCG